MEGWRVRSDCGVCRVDFSGSECQRIIENNDPRLTTRSLCTLALAETLMRNREEGRATGTRHAWQCIDTALNHAGQEIYQTYTNGLLDEAYQAVQHTLENPKDVSIQELLTALSIKNYENLFRARTAGRPITRELIRQTRDNVGALILAIDEIEDYSPKYDGPISGFMAEQCVQWLSLYSEKKWDIIYPSSPRQGHSRMPAFNHDGYQVRGDDEVKVEVKRKHKTRRRGIPDYDPSIIIVVLQDILDKTRSKHGRKIGSRRDNFLIDYIKYDLSGRESGPKEAVLQSATNFLLDDINPQPAIAG